jgi:hypothetical protein
MLSLYLNIETYFVKFSSPEKERIENNFLLRCPHVLILLQQQYTTDQSIYLTLLQFLFLF